MNNALKNIAYISVFCALCFVSTLLIIIPLPNGYVNAGDVLVLLSAWCLGPFGAISASIGCALADILSGYVIYAPATFVIKGATALVAYYVWFLIKKCIKNERFYIVSRIASAVLAELIMVVGYFVFECFLYGVGGAVLSLLGNCIQGAFCALTATLVIGALCKIKTMRNVFPKLY